MRVAAETFLRATVAGFVYGAIIYGGGIAVAHVVYNQLDRVGDALVILFSFFFLYGLAAAAVCAACAVVSAAVSSLGSRAGRAAVDDSARVALAGITVFNLLFWIPFVIYGVTYDQVPFGVRAGVGGMVALLVFRALAVAAVVIGVSRLAPRILPLRLGAARVAAAAAMLVLTAIALPLAYHARPSQAAASAAPAAIERVDTGYKVIVVALDGADWRVIRPMLATGALPTFARLIREGSSGPLNTLAGANSAIIWASIYTGQRPAEHGVRDFYSVSLPGMGGPGVFPIHRTFFKEAVETTLEPLGVADRRFVDRSMLEAPPLWEVADAAGLSSGVIDGYLYSRPAFVPTDPASFFISYGVDDYLRRARAGVEDASQAASYVVPVELLSKVAPLAARADFYWQSAVLLQFLHERPQPTLLSLYAHEPDSRQHLFWRWYQPELYLDRTDPAELARFADMIPGVYRDIDHFLGELLARIDERTVLVVISDHGHSPSIMKRGSYTDHRHGPPGIVIMHGGPVRAGIELADAHVYDVFPTILHLLGLPVPADGAGKVLAPALDGAFAAAHPVRTIASYQTLGAFPAAAPRPKNGLWNAEQVEKLRALGYIR